MSEANIKEIVEALIMASDDPLSADKILKILNSNNYEIDMKSLREVIEDLTKDYSNRALELKEVASGLRFQIKSSLSFWISKLHEERPQKYSRALLETLSLIAYRQPITRAEIEDVRGVAVASNIIKTLLDHEWVKVVGHKEVPGRPALFATTKKFLDHFNMKHLNELPPLAEFTEDLAGSVLEQAEPVEVIEVNGELPIEETIAEEVSPPESEGLSEEANISEDEIFDDKSLTDAYQDLGEDELVDSVDLALAEASSDEITEDNVDEIIGQIEAQMNACCGGGCVTCFGECSTDNDDLSDEIELESVAEEVEEIEDLDDFIAREEE